MRKQAPSSALWAVSLGALLPVALAQQEEPSGTSSNTTIIVVCAVAGVVFILFVAGAVVVCLRRRRARKPIRNRSASNPYGPMDSPTLEEAHQLGSNGSEATPRGRAGGQQPSTMYQDLNRAISDIFGSADDPSKSSPSNPSRGKPNAVYGLSQEPNSYASKTSVSHPDPAMLAGASTTSLNDSRGYHYQRRQHSDEQCTISKPMVRKSISVAPLPRPMVTKSPSYPPLWSENPYDEGPAYPPASRPPVMARPSYPPTSISATSSSPERILTPPSAKGRRKTPPAFVASFAEEPEPYDSQGWPHSYATYNIEPTGAGLQVQSPTAAMFPRKQSLIEPHPLLPTDEPVIYDKDYAQLERTRIAPAQPKPPPQPPSRVQAAVQAEETRVQAKLAQQQAAHAKMVSFSDATPYSKVRSQKKDDRAAFQAAMRREGTRSARHAWERLQ